MLLQLAFLFAEKRHVLSVEVLRQRGDFAIQGETLLQLGQMQLGSGIAAKKSHQNDKTTTPFSHGLIFAINLRLDFCEAGGFFLRP
jgi:hypothetical protein